jgi:hypothetical protein
LLEYAQRYEIEMLLTRIHVGTHKLLELSGVLNVLGEERIHPPVRSAVNSAVEQ